MPLPGIYASAYTSPAAFQGDFWGLNSTTLSANASTITFTGIPNNYTHLQIRGTVLGSAAASGSLQCRINGDSTAVYTRHELGGNGSTAYAYANTAQTSANMYGYYDNIANNNFPCAFIVDILDYQNTTKFKTIRILSGMNKNGANYGEVFFKSSLWQNASPVNSLSIFIGGQDMATYSSISLYGVK